MSIKISDIPAYTGTDIGDTSLVGTVIEGGINVTKRIDTQAILDGIAALASDITGDFKGASDTFAGLPSSGNVNGDYAILRVVDGSNPAGAYVWNGTAWVFSLPISAFGGIGSGTDEGEYEISSPFAYEVVDAWGVPISYITKAGVEVSALSQQVDEHEGRLDALEGGTDLTPWQIAAGKGFINGVDQLAAQSKGVDFKSYYPTTATGLHPLLIPKSYFSFMFAIETVLGVTRGSVYQPDALHRNTTGGEITYDGNSIPPERAIGLVPIQATKDTGIDTQFTGATPTGNFYNQTSMPAFCKRRAELRGQKFTPVSRSVSYNAGTNTTTLTVVLTGGTSVTYGLPERYVTIEGSDQSAFNGTFPTVAAGNAYTFSFGVTGNIPAPTLPFTVYNHNVTERWLASSCGEGGRRLDQFIKGEVYGRRRLDYAKKAKDLGEKFSSGCPRTVYIIRQGESDIASLTFNITSAYKSTVIQAITDNNEAVKKITGQTFNPIYVCYQANGNRAYIATNPNGLMNVGQAHYELCRDGNCVASAPSYILSNEDGIHQTAEWSYILSMYEARAVEDMRVHGARRWLRPTSIVQTGTQVDVQFNVPYGNLTADNELYPLLTYWGFGTRSSDLITDLGLITGITMLNSTTVRLTLSRALATGEWLDYGRGHGQGNHEGYNITTDTFGPYGNLHDQFTEDVYFFQQPTQGRFTRTSLTLRNYSYAFQSQCLADGTFVA
jgi:hypothetical protein